jgi:hypothetical protein
LLGEDPLRLASDNPWQPIVTEDIDTAARAFRESKYDLRALAVAIATSRRSLAREVKWNTASNSEVRSTLQNRHRFLTPELLTLRLKSLLGAASYSSALEQLIGNEMRPALGGLDYLNNSDPISRANTFYSMAFRRVAMESACRITVALATSPQTLPPIWAQLSGIALSGDTSGEEFAKKIGAWSARFATLLSVRDSQQQQEIRSQAEALANRLLAMTSAPNTGGVSELSCASETEKANLNSLSSDQRNRVSVTAAVVAFGLLDPRLHID